MSVTTCPRCLVPRASSSRLCPNCGFDFWADAAVATCPRCQAPRMLGAATCATCGWSFVQAGATMPPAAMYPAGASPMGASQEGPSPTGASSPGAIPTSDYASSGYPTASYPTYPPAYPSAPYSSQVPPQPGHYVGQYPGPIPPELAVPTPAPRGSRSRLLSLLLVGLAIAIVAGGGLFVLASQGGKTPGIGATNSPSAPASATASATPTASPSSSATPAATPTPAPPSPTKKPSPTPAGITRTIRGTFTIYDASGGAIDGTAKDCYGFGGYDDLHKDTIVTVTDEFGNVLASGRLGTGTGSLKKCVFPITVSLVPDAEKTYGVEVSYRGVITYTHAELVKSGWKVYLEIGD